MKKTLPSKYLALAGIIALFLGSPLVSSSRAQGFTITITVDENGNGHFSNTAGFNSALPFGMAADPGPGGAASALTYDLLNPPGLVAGDLLINDGVADLSDVVRFNPLQIGAGGGTGTLVFYSELGEGALADVGFPSALYPNNLTVSEINEMVIYTPTAGQPGYVAGAGGPVTYIIKSGVPDASSSASLLGIGLSGLFCFRRFKRN